MAADHAERRAGRVEQDAVERHAVPPGRGVGRIAGHELAPRRSPRAQVLARPARGAADRRRPRRAWRAAAALRDQRASCRPGAAQASSTRCAGRERQRKRDALRAEVLHRDHALGKARQFAHVARRSSTSAAARAAPARAPMPAARSAARYRRCSLRRQFDPQPHRRLRVAGGRAAASSAPASRRAAVRQPHRRGVAGRRIARRSRRRSRCARAGSGAAPH